MITRKISAFLDMNLTQKLESMVLNLMPAITHSSDVAILYLAETDIVDENGYPTQTKITSADTFFVSIINDGGFIDFSSIKMLHVPETLPTDFKMIEYYPSLENMKYFSTYYDGREVPETGGYMDFAFSPFGPNKIELLNGDVIAINGRGRIYITPDQRGLKGYKEVPEVKEILSSDSFKILKLAVYATYTPDLGRTLSLNLFSPSMDVDQHPLGNRISKNSDKVLAYVTSKNGVFGENGFLENQKNNTAVPCLNIDRGLKTELYGIEDRVYVRPNGYIDLGEIKDGIGSEFSVHTNFVLRDYATRGTMIFEIGYAKGSATKHTRSLSLWLDRDGFIMYNTAFMNEATKLDYVMRKDIENTVTLTISNEVFSEEDDDEFVTFIHVNGEQVWPKSEMLYEYERGYFWKAMTALKIYNDVCLELPAPPPVEGAVDAREICIKKLLHESGFMTKDALNKIYTLYTKRPRAGASDFNTVKFNTDFVDQENPENSYDSTIETIVFGQDGYKDIEDGSFYADIEFSEILVCSPRLNRTQIEAIHLMNTVKVASVE